MKPLTAMFLGATSAAIMDGVMEGIFNSNPDLYKGKFPYIGVPELPPADDWIVLGVSLLPYAIGSFGKRETVKSFGEGMVLYSAPMIVKSATTRWVAVGLAPK
jgi:hypothetical protein